MPTVLPQPTPTYDAQLADWTILVYANADNNLELAALQDINEMEAAGDSQRVQVVVQVDRAWGESYADGDWVETRRYRIVGDADPDVIQSDVVAELGEQNMGDPAVLADFVRWGIETYPANRYALILWNHGAGWQGIAFDGDTAVADYPEDHLSLADLDGALAQGLRGTGVARLDVVGFDACLMGQLDVLETIRPYAAIAVGSEELTPGAGWNYTSLLRQLYARPTADGPTLATSMVNEFVAHYTQVEPDDFVTMTAVDLDQLPAVTYAVERLAAVLATDPAAVSGSIGDARSGAESFARVYPEDVERYAAIDLHHFTAILGQRTGDTAVIEAAELVQTAVADAVIANGHGAGYKNSQGIAVYFPRHAGFYDPAYQQETHLPTWNQFLQAYHQVGQANLPPPHLTLENILGDTVGVQDPAFLQFQIVGRQVEEVRLLAAQVDENGRNRLVEYDLLIPEPTTLPDGTEVMEWRDGVHDDFFIWDTEVTFLSDFTGSGDFVVMWPTEPGSSLFTVQGQFRRAYGSQYVDAQLVFDQAAGELHRVWAVQSNSSDAPAEIAPQAGDEFWLNTFYLADDGALSSEPGEFVYFDDAGQLYYEWLPLPDGRYQLGMEVENIAGVTDAAYVDLTIANEESAGAYQAYLDPYLGFKFLYPQSWYEPRYEEALLYSASQITDTQMLITVYPNLPAGSNATQLQQEALTQFGQVDLLHSETRTIAGRNAVATGYGYTNAAGEPRTGLFFTFVDARNTGYVVDVDGPASDEAATVAAAVTLADSWEFATVGVGLPPGKWQTLALERYSVPQPENFTYQQVNGWDRLSSGAHTFVALRTQADAGDTAVSLADLLQEAGNGVAGFTAGEPFPFALDGQLWTRVDFTYEDSVAGPIWGYVMLRLAAEEELLAWVEAPSASYNGLERDIFLTMLADLAVEE
jgi:hypothetical protein